MLNTMSLCRKISMTDFAMLQTFELEFTAKRNEARKAYCGRHKEAGQDIEKTKQNAPKLKKLTRNKLFLSTKFANSLKKVRLRRKEKSANNNFLYPKKSSLINDEDLKCVKDLPIIPFSPNHLMESSPMKQKHQEIRRDQLNVWNLEKRALANLIYEARRELYNERSIESGSSEDDYVDVYNSFHNQSDIGLNNDDYVDMSALQSNRPRLHSL